MKKSFYLAILLLLLAACSKEDSPVITPPTINHNLSTTIPLSEALCSLDEMIQGLSMVTKSSQAPTYSTASIITIGQSTFPKTKTDRIELDFPDTLMYLVNFDNDKGFAVLAGDTRLGESVYCFAEKGSISANDFAKAFDYLSSDRPYTKTTESEESFYDIGEVFVPALMLSSMIVDIQNNKESIKTKSPTVFTNNAALLTTKWGQRSPFDTYCPPDAHGGTCPTGCVATACAQIMQYCQKPLNPVFDGVSCSWSTMGSVCNYLDPYGATATSLGKEQVARFLFHIGKPSLCNINYVTDHSGGYASGVVTTLNYYGYSNVQKYIGFGATNQSKVSSMLAAGLPAYLDGSDFHNGGGHAWVIDGEYNGHFHCNWGWYGQWDGYYVKHNWFNISNRQGVDSIDSGDDFSTNWSFDWNFRLVTYSI